MLMSLDQHWIDNFRAVVDSEIRSAKGKKAVAYRTIAGKLGIGDAYVYQLYAGKPASNPKRPSKEVMEKLAEVYGRGRDPNWVNLPLAPSPENVAPAPSLRPAGRIPVVGHVKGGDDGYLEEMQFPVGTGEGFVEYWTRDSSAFALRVKGDSMHPRYRAGEFVVVTPHQEAQPGQDVVVKLTNGKKLLKQLNWLRNGEVQLLSINNHYGPMTLSLSEVESIQRVAGSVPSDAFIEP